MKIIVQQQNRGLTIVMVLLLLILLIIFIGTLVYVLLKAIERLKPRQPGPDEAAFVEQVASNEVARLREEHPGETVTVQSVSTAFVPFQPSEQAVVVERQKLKALGAVWNPERERWEGVKAEHLDELQASKAVRVVTRLNCCKSLNPVRIAPRRLNRCSGDFSTLPLNRKTALCHTVRRNMTGPAGCAAAGARAIGGDRPKSDYQLSPPNKKENVRALNHGVRGQRKTQIEPLIRLSQSGIVTRIPLRMLLGANPSRPHHSESCGFPFALTLGTGLHWCPHTTRHACIRLLLPHENSSTSFRGAFLLSALFFLLAICYGF